MVSQGGGRQSPPTDDLWFYGFFQRSLQEDKQIICSLVSQNIHLNPLPSLPSHLLNPLLNSRVDWVHYTFVPTLTNSEELPSLAQTSQYVIFAFCLPFFFDG